MPKLYMVLIGCSPAGRHTEQHDVFFSIGNNIRDILPQAAAFWPDAGKTLHLDGWREVTVVNGYRIEVLEGEVAASEHQLFFLNLGGYKPGEFEEFHYKMLVVATGKGEAIRQAKQTAFYKHTGFKGAGSHIDDQYGVDVDDVFYVPDILPAEIKTKYSLRLSKAIGETKEDALHLGCFKPDTVDKWAPLIAGS